MSYKNCNCNLSKFVADILKIYFREYNEFQVADSKEFASKINDTRLPEDHEIASLDAISLFTNVSLELTVDIIDRNWELIMPYTEIHKEDFIQIIEFIFHSNYFLYNGSFYKQKFGCPMGGSLSSILAEITMSTLLKTQVRKLSFTPHFIFQYVDDLIMTMPADCEEEVLEVFQNFDEHIRFTIERENDRSVPFLDTQLIRGDDNTIKLDWYRKPSSSGRYINASSYHDIKIKINTILGLKKRIEDISHSTLTEKALRKLFHLMKDNGYSTILLKKLLYSAPRPSEPDITPESRHTDDNIQDQIIFAKLPYIKGLTYELTKLFKKYTNIKIGKYTLVDTKLLFNNTKDKIENSKKRNVVYQLKCTHCPLVYIGQTSQALARRMSLHKSDSAIRPERCALGQHIKITGHSIDFKNVTILEQEDNYRKRLFLEMCHIQQNETMNSKSDTNNLSSIYSFLLKCDNNKYTSRNSPNTHIT